MISKSRLVRITSHVQEWTYHYVLSTTSIPRTTAATLATNAANKFAQSMETELKTLGYWEEE